MRFAGIVCGALILLSVAGCSLVSSTAVPTKQPSSASSTSVSPAASPAPSVTPVDPATYDLPWLGADDGVAFNSPDNNIACGIDKSAETGDSYGCAIGTHSYVEPAAPADAADPCGGGFRRFKDSAPGILCSGEPATFAGQPGGAPNVKVLPVGSSITFNGVTCTSAADGIACLSADGHGFRIASDSYALF